MQPEPPDAPDASLGVFETLLARDGRVQSLDAHLERLARSVSDLYGLQVPAQLRTDVHNRAAALSDGHRLRVNAVPHSATLRIALETSPLAPSDNRRLLCTPVVVPGGHGPHKWIDRRRLDALADGRTTPLLVDRDGDVLEAAWANFWLLEDRSLVTPPADGRLLPGVTRALLLELAPSLGLEPREEPISLARARAATDMFLTSSLRLAIAVSLDGQPAALGDTSPVLAAIRTALGRARWV